MIRKGATAIAAWDLCPRRWAFGATAFAVEGGGFLWLRDGEGVPAGVDVAMPAPATEQQARGTAVHAALAGYLTGTPLDTTTEAGLIAMAGVHHLPTPRPGLWVERSWSLGLGSHTVTGTFDLVDVDGGVPVRLYDHKTTGDFKWMKTPEVLREDTQAVLYAWAVLTLCGSGRSELAAQWTYFRAVKPFASRPVSTVVRVTDERLRRLERSLDGMTTAEGCDPVRDLPGVASACDAFGGCPYRSRCTDIHKGIRVGKVHSAESIREEWMRENGADMSTIEAMKKAMQGINPPAGKPDGKTPVTQYSPDLRHNDSRTLWCDEQLYRLVPGCDPWFPVPKADIPPPPPDPPAELPPPPPDDPPGLPEAQAARPRMPEAAREAIANPDGASPKRGPGRPRKQAPAEPPPPPPVTTSPAAVEVVPPVESSFLHEVPEDVPAVIVTDAAVNTLRAASVAKVLRAIADLLEA
jgi:hypothetical protein